MNDGTMPEAMRLSELEHDWQEEIMDNGTISKIPVFRILMKEVACCRIRLTNSDSALTPNVERSYRVYHVLL